MENFYNITINGYMVKETDPKNLLGIILELFDDLKFRSYENLKEINKGVLEILKNYCKKNHEIAIGKRKAQLSRFLKWIEKTSRYNPKSREGMLKKIFELMLYSRELSTLSGFGFTNGLKDRIVGNAEKQRITRDKNINYY